MGGVGTDATLSAPMTVVGMVNGMIGGLILILPVLALNAGYLLTLIVILVTGVFSFYSCYLCVLHMGDQPDLDYAILRHFNGNRSVKIFYDICVWLNLILIDMLYFELIVIQWQGLIPPHEPALANSLANAAALFVLVFVLKYFDFGASLMAYGIISIVTYLLFLIWVIATSDKGYNDVEYDAFGSGAATLAASMGQAFSIQSFFIPVLKMNKSPRNYVFYTMLAYIIGGLAYYYIAYMGSFGILHRKYLGDSTAQQTIEGYFGTGAWQVNIIEAIYLVHLYSVFPEFLLISKKRLFGVIGIQQSHKGNVSIPQVIYIILAIAACLTIQLLGVSISDIIDINGAVIGFFFIYFLPAFLHIKCLYFSKGKQLLLPLPADEDDVEVNIVEETRRPSNLPSQRQSNIEIQQGVTRPLLLPNSKEDQPWKYSEATVPIRSNEFPEQLQLKNQEIQNSYFRCACDKSQYSGVQRAVDLSAMVIMVLLGAFIMVNGIIQVAK